MADTAAGSPGGQRHAVLVDAGYLYASVGQLVLGTTSRRDFRVAAEPLISALIERAATAVPGELLRMYWYDAARDRVPTVEQRQIAALPHVKVRLGNLNSAGQQKGVDAQVRQDLEVLARHRAVSDVVLIAGDEDMVPAVEAAQAYGVRVHVWGVEPPYGVNQAERLVWEADTVEQLDAAFWRPYLESEVEPPVAAAAAAEPVGSGAAYAVDAVAAAGTAAAAGGAAGGTAEAHEAERSVPTPADVFAGRRPAPMPVPPPGTRLGPDRPEMEEIGARIAARWLLTRGRENVADLLPGPVLPTVIDKELLVEAEEEISRSLRPYEDARRALRDGFWARLHRDFGISTDADAPFASLTGSPAAPTGSPAAPTGSPAAPTGSPAAPTGSPAAPTAEPPAAAAGSAAPAGSAAAGGPAAPAGPSSAPAAATDAGHDAASARATPAGPPARVDGGPTPPSAAPLPRPPFPATPAGHAPPVAVPGPPPVPHPPPAGHAAAH